MNSKLWLASFLISISVIYFIIYTITGFAGVPPKQIHFGIIGAFGILLVMSDLFDRLNRWLNQRPKPPYFVITKESRELELDENGSYESCQSLLAVLKTEFDAEYSVHLEAGPRPLNDNDKNKGYWNLIIFGQDFFLMRVHGNGISISGPKPPEDINGFMRLVAFYKAEEFLTWQQKFVRYFVRDKTKTNAKKAN